MTPATPPRPDTPRTRTDPSSQVAHSAQQDPPGDVAPADARALLEQFADLESRFDVLKAQVRQAQQLAALGTTAATIAHEVNNLLTPIKSYARAALSANDDKLMRRALEVTERNVDMLVRMTDRVLEIGAAKTRKTDRVPIAQSIRDAADSLCRDLDKDGIKLQLDIDENLAASADGLQIRQVMFNVLLNAREALSKQRGGRIRATGLSQGGRVIVEINNTGEPIPAEMLPRIFDALQSSKSIEAPERLRCSGLGLALCRDLIEENGGSISVTSDAESGTTFRIDLPAHQ